MTWSVLRFKRAHYLSFARRITEPTAFPTGDRGMIYLQKQEVGRQEKITTTNRRFNRILHVQPIRVAAARVPLNKSCLLYSDGPRKGKSLSMQCVDDSNSKFKSDTASSGPMNHTVSRDAATMDETIDIGNNSIQPAVADKDDLIEIEEDIDAESDFYEYIQSEDSIDELLSILLGLEEYFPAEDPRISCTCLRLAELCNQKNANPEKILDYARKAFHIFDASKAPMKSARSLLMMGIGHFKMGEFKAAMAPLDKAAMMLETVATSADNGQELSTLQYIVQSVLGQVKMALGWHHEAMLDFGKGLASIERVLSTNDHRLGTYYQQVIEAYLQVKNPKGALNLCLKAFPIYYRVYGSDSLEEAELRSLLLQIYYELNDYENVISESEKVTSIFKCLGRKEESLSVALESIRAFFHLGKFEEAIAKLSKIIEETHKENPFHVEALILLARAYAGQREGIVSARYCAEALNILEGDEIFFESAKSLVRLSMVYEELANYDQAMLIIHKALGFFRKHGDKEANEIATDIEGHVGYLYLCKGKPDEAIPYLERSLSREDTSGVENTKVANNWNHLGVAFARVKRFSDALSAFEEASNMVIDDRRGPHSLSIYIHNNLSLTCKMIGRIEDAITHKRNVIDLMKKTKNHPFHMDEALEELDALVLAAKSGRVDQTSEQVLDKMLRTCSETWINN